jgi:hypothetical protein
LTLDDVARTVPEVDPLLTCRIIVSVPSVVRSFVSVLVTVPVLLVMVNEPEFRLSLKSAFVVVPELVQYNVVPSAVLAVIVKRTLAPSLTEDVFALIDGAVDTSLTVSEAEFARIVPVLLPERILRTIVSEPSVVRSEARVLLIVAVLLVMVNEPELFPSEKSAPFVVPEFVQYRVVPSEVFAVTVYVTLRPSLIDVTTLAEIVGAAEVSATVTVLELATIVPDVLPVRMLRIIDSVPSVVRSLTRVLVTVAELLLIVIEPEFRLSLKSADAVLPEFVQYRVVPSSTSVVVIVKRTDEPSLTEDVFGDTAYVGLRLVSMTVTRDELATIVPAVLPVRILMTIDSEPSVR